MNTARLHIFGHDLIHRDSAGNWVLLSYHPRGSSTWHWSVCLAKGGGSRLINRAVERQGQWHDYYRLPFGYCLIVSQQDWHKAKRH
jgi:hypothetical protein